MNNSLVESVWSLAVKFMNNAELVTINDEKVSEVAKDVAAWRKVNSKRFLWGFPKCINEPKAITKLFFYELIASSVNYCYWYGRYNIRPNGASATMMYDLLDKSFAELEEQKKTATFHPHDELEIIVDTFIAKLSRARFPLIDRRVDHLTELLNRSDLLSVIEISVSRKDYSVESWLDYIVTSFPGYSKDLFLKRAFLFIMQMYRRHGIFEKEIGKILVPADYQVPRVLRHLGCLEYRDSLAWIVDGGMLIPEGGREECEIRAATIVACENIATLADCSCEQVDTYLWNKRNESPKPFHLTITTNY